MSRYSLQVFVASFPSEDAADATLKDFRARNREGSIDLIDAGVAVHTSDGKPRIQETADPSGKTWGKRGAIAGGIVGLIFPPSIIAGALIGGGAGSIWGRIRDKGFRDENLQTIPESLPAGSSAIATIAEDDVVEPLQRGLEGYQRLARHSLSAQASAQLMADQGSPLTGRRPHEGGLHGKLALRIRQKPCCAYRAWFCDP